MLKLSLDTTLEYAINAGGSVERPPETSLYLHVNLPPIFMSKIIWHTIYWKSGIHFPLLILYTVYELLSKSILKLTISFWIYCSQKLVPTAWSIYRASLDVSGILVTNLWVHLQYRVLNLEIMWSLERNTWPIYQLKTRSSWIWFAVSY